MMVGAGICKAVGGVKSSNSWSMGWYWLAGRRAGSQSSSNVSRVRGASGLAVSACLAALGAQLALVDELACSVAPLCWCWGGAAACCCWWIGLLEQSRPFPILELGDPCPPGLFGKRAGARLAVEEHARQQHPKFPCLGLVRRGLCGKDGLEGEYKSLSDPPSQESWWGLVMPELLFQSGI